GRALGEPASPRAPGLTPARARGRARRLARERAPVVVLHPGALSWVVLAAPPHEAEGGALTLVTARRRSLLVVRRGRGGLRDHERDLRAEGHLGPDAGFGEQDRAGRLVALLLARADPQVELFEDVARLFVALADDRVGDDRRRRLGLDRDAQLDVHVVRHWSGPAALVGDRARLELVGLLLGDRVVELELAQRLDRLLLGQTHEVAEVDLTRGQDQHDRVAHVDRAARG